MAYTIIWSPLAEETYFEILEYLLEKWTEREALNFEARLLEVLDLLKENPQIYAYSKEKKSYRAVLTRQTTLIYRVKETNLIELVTFWGNRQDPEKLTV